MMGACRTAVMPAVWEFGMITRARRRLCWPVLVALMPAATGIAAATTAAAASVWQPASAPLLARSSDHTATLLEDGRVLVVGGVTCGAQCAGADHGISSAELFDPASGRWTATGAMSIPRQYHTATRLADGRVLVVGGYTHGTSPRGELRREAEIYDPKTGVWGSGGSIRTGRIGHTASLLATGRVLVAGGLILKSVAGGPPSLVWDESTEIYDPATRAWNDAAPMNDARAEHTATVLRDGRVLVAGGRNTPGLHSDEEHRTEALNTAEIYEPVAGTWHVVGHLLKPARAAHTATLLRDGTVLLAGGSVQFDHGGGGHPTDAATLFRPLDGTFVDVHAMTRPRLAQSAALLDDGSVLVVGGLEAEDVRHGVHTVPSSERYNPSTRTWAPAPEMPADPTSHAEREMRNWLFAGHNTATALPGNEVLVLGGDAGRRSAQIFEPEAAGSRSPSGAGGPPVGALIAGGAVLALAAGLAVTMRRRRSLRS